MQNILMSMFLQRPIDDLHYFECGSRRGCYLEPYDCRGKHGLLCTVQYVRRMAYFFKVHFALMALPGW